MFRRGRQEEVPGCGAAVGKEIKRRPAADSGQRKSKEKKRNGGLTRQAGARKGDSMKFLTGASRE